MLEYFWFFKVLRSITNTNGRLERICSGDHRLYAWRMLRLHVNTLRACEDVEPLGVIRVSVVHVLFHDFLAFESFGEVSMHCDVVYDG